MVLQRNCICFSSGLECTLMSSQEGAQGVVSRAYRVIISLSFPGDSTFPLRLYRATQVNVGARREVSARGVTYYSTVSRLEHYGVL